jgi:hypothetical protein
MVRSSLGYYLVRTNARDLDRRGVVPPAWLWWAIMGPAFLVIGSLTACAAWFVGSFAGWALFGI